MRKLSCVVLAAMSLGAVEGVGSGSSFAIVQTAAAQSLPAVWQTKADRLTKSIAREREKFAADAATILADDFKRKQFEDLVQSFHKSLARIPAADDPKRNAAVAELASLEAELNAAKAGGGTAAAPVPASDPAPAQAVAVPAEPAPTSDPAQQPTSGPELVPSERAKLSRVMSQIAKSRAYIRRVGLNGDANKISQSYQTARQNLQRFNKYDDPAAVRAREAFAALGQDIHDLQSLARSEDDLGTTAAQMAELREPLEGAIAAGKPSALQDPDVRKQLRDKIGEYAEYMSVYRKRTTPNAVAALSGLDALTAAMKREEQRADAQLKELGDLSARYDALFAKMKRERDTIAIPEPLDAPFTAERVAAWRAEAAKAVEPEKANLAELNGMLALAYDSEKLTALAEAAKERLADIGARRNPIGQHLNTLRAKHNSALANIAGEARAWKSETMPESGPLFAAFAANDAAAAKAYIDASIASVQTVIDTENAFEMDTALRMGLISDLGRALVDFDEALADAGLPEAKSTNPEMLAFAKAALEDDEEIGEYGPIILLSKHILGGEYTYARASGSGSGTVSLQGSTSIWKNFDFVVPIKTGDVWHLWRIEAYNYASSNVHPMGVWIVQKKTKGKPLPRSAFE